VLVPVECHVGASLGQLEPLAEGMGGRGQHGDDVGHDVGPFGDALRGDDGATEVPHPRPPDRQHGDEGQALLVVGDDHPYARVRLAGSVLELLQLLKLPLRGVPVEQLRESDQVVLVAKPVDLGLVEHRGGHVREGGL